MNFSGRITALVLASALLSGCSIAKKDADEAKEIVTEAIASPSAVQTPAVVPTPKTTLPSSPRPSLKPSPSPKSTSFGEYETLNSKPNGWGFKRNPGGRPEFSSSQVAMMNKYGCIYMGSSSSKDIYLTFDEGYENGYTPMILDTLKKTNTPAVFFITGSYLNKQKNLVERMLNEGHIVGNHTMNHPSLPSVKTLEEFEEEILGLDRRFYEDFGTHMSFLRPPQGDYSERTLAIAKDLGYTCVFWSLAYRDWLTNEQKGADYAYKNVMDNLHSGAVVLLHAVSKDNAEALERIITDARNQGYVFRRLDEYNN